MKTSPKLTATLATTITILALSYLPATCFSDNYTTTYQLLNEPNGTTHYSLNIAIPQSLYEYYTSKDHRLNTENDFAKFVTPYALKPVADNLRQIYNNTEDFTNGALMIAHQTPYEATTPSKYPVETIQDNKGDCDLFSYIVASILKAAGLDTVLLYYESASHMNVGVNLPNVPQDSRDETFYVTHNNIRYYVGECTGGNWQNGWRIGECPNDLEHAAIQVITLENCEQYSTGQVSASYKTPASSTLTLDTSTTFTIQGSTMTLSGNLSPNLQNRNITLYTRINTSPWTILDTTTTDSNGHFDYAWIVNAGGICYVRASWSGDENYSAADSPTRTITSLSMLFVSLLALTIILVTVGTAVYLMTRHTQQAIPEPQPPEIPT